MSLDERDLIHDWNRADGTELEPAGASVHLNDETLRDGLQSPSAISPSVESKRQIVHLLAELGIDALDLGLPGAGPHVVADVTALAREIVDHDLPLAANCAARTVAADILAVVEIAQRTGLEIELACFLGSSPIRQYAEGWDMDRLLRLTHDAVSLAAKEGLPVMYVTEDTTRARPDDIRRLYTEAVEAGARRVCIADTVGHATPSGAGAVTRFVRDVVDATGETVKVDWHGHRDRGLSVINALVAAAAGADRIHATVLGLGERVGNTPLDHLLVNFHLLGWRRGDLSRLPELCRLVADATGVPFPANWPILGLDAFRTGTGVHAAAIIKARAKGEDWLADRIYSGVPASLVGRRQLIEVGPMSGMSNVTCWLSDHGIEPVEGLEEAILECAKRADEVLGDDRILAICADHGVTTLPEVER